MKNETVYLTFKTDRDTSEFLKEFAHICKMTQPELINDICQDFKAKVIKELKRQNTTEREQKT